MNGRFFKPTSIIPTAILSFATVLMLPTVSNAQRVPSPDVDGPLPAGAGARSGARPPSIRERQFRVNEMEREAAKLRTPEEERLAMAQIAEDFEQIQIINNKMMGTTMRSASPDYGNIAETTAEIKKRARRLKDNLLLTEIEGQEEVKPATSKKEIEPGQTKANLLMLDESIMTFIKNPIFKSTQVVELAQANKARQEVDEIIQLSELIKKDVERLRKTSGTTSEKPD